MFPKVAHEVDAALHHCHGSGDIVGVERVGVYAVSLKNGLEEFGELLVGNILKICMVEPFTLLECELGTCLLSSGRARTWQ